MDQPITKFSGSAIAGSSDRHVHMRAERIGLIGIAKGASARNDILQRRRASDRFVYRRRCRKTSCAHLGIREAADCPFGATARAAMRTARLPCSAPSFCLGQSPAPTAFPAAPSPSHHGAMSAPSRAARPAIHATRSCAGTAPRSVGTGAARTEVRLVPAAAPAGPVRHGPTPHDPARHRPAWRAPHPYRAGRPPWAPRAPPCPTFIQPQAAIGDVFQHQFQRFRSSTKLAKRAT